MRFDPFSLRLFAAIAQTGSISAAAERMNIALAAASRRIVQLEDDAGVVLLHRRPRGVTLTAAGTVLLRHAHEIENAFNRMRRDIADHASGAHGSVRIMANSSSVLQFLPQDLPPFLARHRKLRIDLTERPSDEVLRSVREGTAELGVCHAAAKEGASDLSFTPYRRDELVLIVPAASPWRRRRSIRFEEVLDQDFIVFPPGTALRSLLVAAAHDKGATLKVGIQVRGFDTHVRMVASGLGVGVLPAGALPSPVPPGVHVIALREPWAQRQHFIVHKPVDTLSPPAKMLAAFLAHAGEP